MPSFILIFLYLFSFPRYELSTINQWSMLCLFLLATQKEFLEHADSFNVDDLAKFILLDEKELGIKVAETGENIKKSICHDILSHLGSEAVLYEDATKKGILGVILTSLIIYFFTNLNFWTFLLPSEVFNSEFSFTFFSPYTCCNSLQCLKVKYCF